VATDFDPGYGLEPFASIVRDYPGDDVYPGHDFRVEWGPIFHRGRLDGSARVLVLGQDPAAEETIVRRILVGEAGHRLQGLLFKLGFDRSYVLINTFLYSVLGHGGQHHQDDAAIGAYRARWLQAIFDTAPIEAVIALGTMADHAWKTWADAPDVGYIHITHPTQPESASASGGGNHAQLIKAMLHNWNQGMDAIAPHIQHPDTARPLTHYGDAFAPGDKVPIPAADLPPGLPAWVADNDGWAKRNGRDTITVKVPAGSMPS
jgi:hypothetical protein